MPENFDLFISHATSDDDTVNRIYKAITDAGLTAWVDHQRGITYGANWSRAIHDGSNACRYGLFVMSPASVKSEYCEAEWNRIQGLKKRLYIVQIDNIPLADVPLRLGIVQTANLIADFDGKLADLIVEIKRQRDIDAPATTIAKAGSLTGPFPFSQLDLPMIGREDDANTITEMLKTHRAAQILGLGGIGKSRLLAEFAWRGGYADGVIWHDMATYPALEQLSALIRDHLGLPPTTDDDQTWAALNSRPVLLALDNGETAANPAAYAARINRLDLNGGSRILLTSRLRWDDLRNAPQRDLRAPSPESAVKILEAMAESEPPAHQPGDQAAALAEAARYHPRLMWYAVRWLDDYPPSRVLTMLRDLKGADAEAALEDMVGRTVKQLKADPGGEDALTALKKLAVCKGGFTFEAAEALGAADSLKPLRRRGLVRVENERYEIDPLVITAVGTDESARRTHYDYYKALAKQHDKKQDYLGLDVESANLEAAFEWTMSAKDFEAAYWLANACANFLDNRGRFGQLMVWFTLVETELKEFPEGRLKGYFYISLGEVYRRHPIGNLAANLRRAIAAFEVALIYYTPTSAPLDYAMTQNNLGATYRALSEMGDRAGNLHRAIAAYEAALVNRTPAAVPLDYATTQNNLGNAYSDLARIEDQAGNLRRAVSAYEAALFYRTPAAAPLAYAQTQNNLGIAYSHLAEIEDQEGNLRRAVTAFEAALVYRTPTAAPLDYAMTRYNMALVYRALSREGERETNLKQAIAAYQDALRFRTRESAPIYYAQTQWGLGIAHEDLGDTKAAILCWSEAERVFRLMDMPEQAEKMARFIADAGEDTP